MLEKRLLIGETVVLGLMLALCLPVWAVIPMLFGVTENTPPAAARRVYILLLAFPLVAIGSMVGAWMLDQPGPVRPLLMALPVAHIIVLYLARVKH